MLQDLLPIFPNDSAAITVSATVWVGVVVAVVCNLRLGWSLSALVVPGYLVPLLISRPATAMVVFTEAVVTYLLARLISDGLNKTAYWSSFFGRDRFFVIVVVSVIVRATFDGWLLPQVGRYVSEELGWNFDYRNELQSFGLIVVALIANYFWRPGLKRGLLPITTGIAITWGLVLLLGEVTNLRLGNFHLIYEDVSTSLLASPKSYVILITTAFLASWINLRYAWDFNGILIPALLGLTLHEPMKIVTTIAECMLIYSVGSLLLKAPLIRDIAMQGGRKLLFFFTVCFGLRLLMSHAIPVFYGSWEVADALGLGYLLSTLMAVKAHDKKLMVRMLKGTLQVSLVGGIAGSLIGFCLLWVGKSLHEIPVMAFAKTSDIARVIESQQSVGEIVRGNKPLLYEKHEIGSYQTPVYSDLKVFRSALVDLAQLEEGYYSKQLLPIAGKLASVNYSLVNLSGRKLFLKERAPARGWGMYMVDPGQRDGICFEVPAPLDEEGTLESGLTLIRKFPASGLAIAGAKRMTNIDGSADVTRYKNTMFSVFHSVFGQRQTVQLRSMTRRLHAATVEGNTGSKSGAAPQSRLFVKSGLPSDLKLEFLKSIVGSYDIQWQTSPFANRVSTATTYAELAISRPVRERLMKASLVSIKKIAKVQEVYPELNQTKKAPTKSDQISVAQQSMQSFLADAKSKILKMGSNRFVPATMQDMLFMDNEVVGPLISLMGEIEHDNDYVYQEEYEPLWLTRQVRARLDAVNSAAHIQGYQLQVIVDALTGEQAIALSENALADQIKGWGTYLFRPSLMQSLGVEIPRPLFENRSFDFGVSLFKRPRASVLLIAGAHPRANNDGTADISKSSNRRNLFNLVRQVLFRKFDDRPFLICQARAIQAPVQHDIVVATDRGNTRLDRVTPLKRDLIESLQQDHFSIGFVDGSHDTAGYELGLLMKASAIQVSQNKEVVSLWLSPSLRTKYRQQSVEDSLSAQMAVCGIDTVETSLVDYLKSNFVNSNDTAQFGARPPKVASNLKVQLNDYVANFDVVRLLKATTTHPQWKFTHVVDTVSGQAFLLVSAGQRRLAAMMNLTGFIGTDVVRVNSAGRFEVDEFVSSRKLWLEVNGK